VSTKPLALAAPLHLTPKSQAPSIPCPPRNAANLLNPWPLSPLVPQSPFLQIISRILLRLAQCVQEFALRKHR